MGSSDGRQQIYHHNKSAQFYFLEAADGQKMGLILQ